MRWAASDRWGGARTSCWDFCGPESGLLDKLRNTDLCRWAEGVLTHQGTGGVFEIAQPVHRV